MKLGNALKPKFKFKDFKAWTAKDMSPAFLDFESIKAVDWFVYSNGGGKAEFIQLGADPLHAFIFQVKTDEKIGFGALSKIKGHEFAQFLTQYAEKGMLILHEESIRRNYAQLEIKAGDTE